MRKLIVVCLAAAGLSLGACSKAEQAHADREVKQAGDKVSDSVKGAVHDVASDEDVRKARAEVDKAAADAGAAVKDAAGQAGSAVKTAATDAAKDAALSAKQAVHDATALTPEEKQALADKKEEKKKE